MTYLVFACIGVNLLTFTYNFMIDLYKLGKKAIQWLRKRYRGDRVIEIRPSDLVLDEKRGKRAVKRTASRNRESVLKDVSVMQSLNREGKE